MLSTVIGTLCAYGLWKRNSRTLTGALYLSLVTPEIVSGISLLALFQWAFRWLHWQLGLYTVVLAHVAFSIAYVVIVVSARLRTVSPALEEAAMDLGANPWQAFWYVTLPALAPGILAAALLALTVSFDDYVITSMVAGVDSETLPMVIYAMARRGASPVINAISALITRRLRRPDSDLRKGARNMNRRYFIAGTGRTRRLCARSAPAPQRLQLVGLRRAGDHSQLRSGIRRARPLRHLRKQRGDAGQSHHRQLRLGRRLPHAQPPRADARQWLARARCATSGSPDLTNLDARFQAPAWDAALQWGVPYMWNGTGIVYNRSLQPPPARWADLWSPQPERPPHHAGRSRRHAGRVPQEARPAVQRHRSRRSCARAEQEAIAQKPLLRAYLNAEVRDQLVAGDVLAAQLWSTTAQQAIDAAPQLAFVYPAEGFPFYCDCAVILRESRRARLAHQFLDYLLRPAVSAKIVEATRTATANAAALDLLPESVRRTPSLYPPPEIFDRGEWPRTLDPATQRLRDRIWTEIKSA